MVASERAKEANTYRLGSLLHWHRPKETASEHDPF